MNRMAFFIVVFGLLLFGCATQTQESQPASNVVEEETPQPVTHYAVVNYTEPTEIEVNETTSETPSVEEEIPVVCPNITVSATVVPSFMPTDVGVGYWVDYTLFDKGVNWNGWNAEASEAFRIGDSEYEPLFCNQGMKVGQNVNYLYCTTAFTMIRGEGVQYYMVWVYFRNGASYSLKEIVYEDPTKEEICRQVITPELPSTFQSDTSHVNLDRSDLECPNISIESRVVPTKVGYTSYQLSESVLANDVKWNGWETKRVFVQEMGTYRYEPWVCGYGSYTGEDPSKMYCSTTLGKVAKSITDNDGIVLEYRRYIARWGYTKSGEEFVLYEARYSDMDNATRTCNITYAT